MCSEKAIEKFSRDEHLDVVWKCPACLADTKRNYFNFGDFEDGCYECGFGEEGARDPEESLEADFFEMVPVGCTYSLEGALKSMQRRFLAIQQHIIEPSTRS